MLKFTFKYCILEWKLALATVCVCSFCVTNNNAKTANASLQDIKLSLASSVRAALQLARQWVPSIFFSTNTF